MPLRPYQADAVKFLHARKRALLALPPGAGKTAIVATALPAGRTLIVAPNGPVLDHWCRELSEWSDRVIGLIGAGDKARRSKVRSLVANVYTDVALVLNYECFRNDIDALAEIEWDVVVFDESHRLKNRQSQTFKAAKRLKAEDLYLVSGTPVLNRATELWTSLHLMDPKQYRGFWAWAERFFHIVFPRYRRRIVRSVCADLDCKVCGGSGLLSPEHARILRKQLAERMFYRPLDEILPDLPPVTETYYEVDLSEAERAANDTMLEKAWMELSGELIQAENAIAKMTRLRQLCSDWSVFGEAPGTKAQVAAQLVDELDGEPCVVFVAFRATADAVASILPHAEAYHGGLGPIERADALDRFKDPDCTTSTLVATIATLGEGVDGLQHVAHTAIFLDRDWTPARNDQAVARLRRQGQLDSVNVIHIVARDTVDDIVNDALRNKRDVVSAVIEGSKDAVHSA